VHSESVDCKDGAPREGRDGIEMWPADIKKQLANPVK
jgi:hypothetical protein